MNCENAQQNMILAQYGELPDELQFPLEQHVDGCEDCRREWNALQALNEDLSLVPMREPSPNLLTASRMRLDEALDAMPARSVTQRVWGNAFRWLSFVQGAPALAVLLLGVGFIGGNFLERYQVVHMAKLPTPVILSNTSGGAIASVSGIVQTPNSELVSVNYNRLVPETVQGSLDDPQIRQLLMLGTKLATTNEIHAQSVDLLAGECMAGHDCETIRTALLALLHTDKNPTVRLTALRGLQQYVAQDEHVRNAVLDALMQDKSAEVRTQAISMLVPVQADSSVQQVLHTVSTQDANPAIREAAYRVTNGTPHIE